MAKPLELAARRNRGKRLMPAFLEQTSRALGVAPDAIRTMALEDTDAIRAIFASSKTNAEAGGTGVRTWALSTGSLDELKPYVALAASEIPKRELCLFLDHSPWCGAVLCSTSQVLSHLVNLLTLDQQDLIATSKDGSTGLFCSWMTLRPPYGAGTRYDFFAWDRESK